MGQLCPAAEPLLVRILERTQNISPTDAPYDDCDFTVKLEMVKTKKKHIAIVPMFRKRILSPESELKPGQIVSMEPETRSEQQKYIQLADDLQQLDYEYIYLRLTREKQRDLRSAFAGLRQSIPELLAAQRERIALYEKNAPEIRRRLKEFWHDQGQKAFGGVNGAKGFYFISPIERFNRSFRNYAVPAPEPQKYYRSCRQYISDMNDYLKARGIPLVVIICPVYDELFCDDMLRMNVDEVPLVNYPRAKLIEDCLADDIFAIDILPELLKRRTGDSFLYYYNLDNCHISPMDSFVGMSRIAQLAGFPAGFETSKQIFYLNSRFLGAYKGGSLTETPQIKRSDKSTGDILLIGDSMSLEGYGFPNSIRYFFNADVKAITMPSRAGETFAVLREKDLASRGEFLKNVSACFFIMNGNYINTFFKTALLMEIEAATKKGRAQIAAAPAAAFDPASGKTRCRVRLSDALRKAPSLAVAVNIPGENLRYTLSCNGRQKLWCDITGFSGGNICPGCFLLSPAEFDGGWLDLEIAPPDKRQVKISNIIVAPTTGAGH